MLVGVQYVSYNTTPCHLQGIGMYIIVEHLSTMHAINQHL